VHCTMAEAPAAGGDSSEEREALVAQVESEEVPASNQYVFVLTALSAIGGFLFGYDTGVISGAMLLLVEEFGFDHKQQEAIVSVTLVGCIIAAVAASVATERLGRQPVILLGSAIFAGASLVLATAATLERLLLGRFIVGIAVGLASMAVPVYVSSRCESSQHCC
jgi:SP family myo-inositol transporter-like MFS transporter 13